VLWSDARVAASEAFRGLLLELAQERSLGELLPLVARRLAEHEDVALARLWLLEPADVCASCPNQAACSERTRCLHLVASAARSRAGHTTVPTQLGGAFRRIPVGAFKVGLVAAEGRPILVTDPAHDPKIRHPAWVREEGIAGFAGLPLTCRGELLGVLGVFVRAPITPTAMDVLSIVANHAAAAIATARAFAQVESMRRQLVAENQQLRRSVEADPLADMVGGSPRLREVLGAISAVASTDATVLVQGESGTGKELVARAIHQRSHRSAGPLVEVNCAAIPRDLAESELFGHVRGAFTGASRDRVGRFEGATGGTLFLDELGELPLELQGKLLRVLQEGTYERVGEGRTRRTDVRVVAATNRDLLSEVERGSFRQDLYYRLNVYPITLPPLRERHEDIPELAQRLLERICHRLRRPPLVLTAEQLADLAGRPWPGNVRELLNVLERSVISAGRTDVLALWPGGYDPSSGRPASESTESAPRSRPPSGPSRPPETPGLPASGSALDPAMAATPMRPTRTAPPAPQTTTTTTTTTGATAAPSPTRVPPGGTAVPALEGPPPTPVPVSDWATASGAVVRDFDVRRFERENLRQALARCQGRIYGPQGAAALLGLKPTTLASRLKRLGIQPDPPR
jgi:transcriptional regulator with GAF, ATPase, and Fis domain